MLHLPKLLLAGPSGDKGPSAMTGRGPVLRPTVMVGKGVPPVVVLICVLLIWQRKLDWCPLDAVELFSGTQAITQAFLERGYRAHGYDIEDPTPHAVINTNTCVRTQSATLGPNLPTLISLSHPIALSYTRNAIASSLGCSLPLAL